MKYKKIYFVGIKGVGMASLAVLAHEAGIMVGGCDVAESFMTDAELANAGIAYDVGFEPESIKKFIGSISAQEVLVIVTAAHGGSDNRIVLSALELGIETLSYGKALGEFIAGDIFGREFEGISVAGAHGKTTISAFIAFCLSKLKHDPSYIVGTSEILGLGAAGHYGQGKYFVAEADEYASDLHSDRTSKFLYQFPKYLIINNIDFDHPDFFQSIQEVEKSYTQFVANIHGEGVLFANGDDSRVLSVAGSVSHSARVITYGTGEQNNYSLSNFKEVGLSSEFTLSTPEMLIGQFHLSIPGYHNAKNALPVIAFLIEIGISIQRIQEVLAQFMGTKRRIEKIGITAYGAEVFDDYAHHPQEIKASLQALHGAFPHKKLVCIFQPHTYSRSHALLKEFVGSFENADELIILPTFASAREEEGNSDSIKQQMQEGFHAIQKSGIFLENQSDVVEYIRQHFKTDQYLIVTMGAGDVYKIGENLKAE